MNRTGTPGATSSADPDRSRSDRAAHGLRSRHPELSAASRLWPWQRAALMLLLFGVPVAAFVSPNLTMTVTLALLALPFLYVVTLRAAALINLASMPSQPLAATRVPDERLPRYSVLVPLYREAEVVPGLVASLCALDYPTARLDVLLIVEAVDPRTRKAIADLALPDHMRMVVVPDGAPRTKPRALNYALQEAAGDYVVVYDAEDAPDPGQLRAAIALFSHPQDGARLGCVQAKLAIANGRANWLTRQFAIEYAALFGALLPTLEWLGLPIPLGGTSNHFPRAVLEAAGGWDAYNVTEDADLGVRLARTGYAVAILDSTTSEEAPLHFDGWLRQRTRWLKGYMQTYLVHLRQPVRLWRELGWRQFAGLQVLMGGLILSALVHPWFYVLFLAHLLWQPNFETGAEGFDAALLAVGAVNLVAGYATAAALGAASVGVQDRSRILVFVLTMPVYWLAISLAAYRALLQIVAAPYLWEKTDHSARPSQAAGVASSAGQD